MTEPIRLLHLMLALWPTSLARKKFLSRLFAS